MDCKIIYLVISTDGRVFRVEGSNVDEVLKKCPAINVKCICDDRGVKVYEN